VCFLLESLENFPVNPYYETLLWFMIFGQKSGVAVSYDLIGEFIVYALYFVFCNCVFHWDGSLGGYHC